MPRSNVVEAVLRQCRADGVLIREPRVVVAVSGGPDSTALLHAMARAAPRLNLQLTAAHLDHGLRRASAEDARRVAAICAALEVTLVSRRRRPRGNSEEAARDVRYAYLEEVAADVGAATIALGHSADDQAETVLMHLIRGSGLEGLAAMQVREGLRFRPLLGTWREDIEEHCRRHGLEPVDDASNRDPKFTRNRVRQQLLPLLESFNPRVKASLVRLASSARDEHEVVRLQAAVWLAGEGRRPARAHFRALPPALRVESFRQAWAHALDGRALPGTAALIDQAVILVCSDRERGMLPLRSGLSLYVRDGRFWIGPTGPR
jgi:tRNA(Ile)-lysidine synthase